MLKLLFYSKLLSHYVYVQMLAAVSNIANQTSALCNACRVASSKTTNPVAKRQFVQSAKDLANNTALMVKSMKVKLSNIL